MMHCDATSGRASDDVFIEYQSKLAQLRAFLLRTQRYGSLSLVASSSSSSSSSSQSSAPPSVQQRQIIVLDDLPFLGRPELQADFNDILLRVLPSSVHLMVVLYTEEHESSGGIWRVLDARLQNRCVEFESI